MLNRLKAPWRNVALGVIAVLIAWFLWSVRSALNPLGLGLLFAYMLHPMVTSLERVGWSRKMAVNLIFGVSAIGALVLSLALMGQAKRLWEEVTKPEGGALSEIDETLRGGAESVSEWVYLQMDRWDFLGDEEPEQPAPSGDSLPAAEPDGEPVDGVEPAPAPSEPAPSEPAPTTPVQSTPGDPLTQAIGQMDAGDDAAEAPVSATEQIPRLEDVFNYLRGWFAEEGRLEQAGEAGLRAAGGMWSVLRRLFGSLLTFSGYLVLVPIYTWFLLFELERISEFLRKYIPRSDRERFANIGSQITEMLGNFFRGRMLVCVLKGFVLAVVLQLAGFPYALLLGVISGILSLIPFVGPFVGYGLAFLLGLLEFSLGEAVIRMIVVYTIGEVIEGYVLLPRVLGDSMGLHPIVVIASLMIFGAALGMFGMLLALPLMSAAVILANELLLPVLRDIAEGDGAGGDSPPGSLAAAGAGASVDPLAKGAEGGDPGAGGSGPA